MSWDFLRISLIFLSHTLTLPLICESKAKLRKPWLIWACSFLFLEFFSLFILLCFGVFDVVSGGVLLVLASAVYLLISIAVWNGPVLKSVFLFTSYCVYYLFGADLSLCLSMLPYIDPRYSEFVMIVTLAVMSMVCIIVLCSGVKEHLFVFFDGIRKGWGILAAFSICVFAVVAFLVMLSLFYVISDFAVSMIIFFCLFILVTSVYGIVFQMIRLLKNHNDESMLLSSEKLLNNELEAERRIIDSAKRFRHDMRHHNNIIREYLYAGDLEGTKEYIRKYDSSLNGNCQDDFSLSSDDSDTPKS